MVSRIALLVSLAWVMTLTQSLFTVFNQDISGRDLILLLGGVFLLYKASHEIYMEVEAQSHEETHTGATSAKSGASQFWGTIAQIGVVDIVFSLDSVITAVGMVDQVGVMVAAVIASVAVMMFAAKPIGDFVDQHPSIKVLALAFLTMVGTLLIAEAFDVHVPKGYVYTAMLFSLGVESLNIRARKKRRKA
jgi:predicted tellurium resistance membrane protein TerC